MKKTVITYKNLFSIIFLILKLCLFLVDLMSMDMDMEENKLSHTVTKNSVVSNKHSIKLSNPLMNSSNPSSSLGSSNHFYASNNQPMLNVNNSQNLAGTLRSYNSLIGGNLQNISTSGVSSAVTKPLFVINNNKSNYTSNPNTVGNSFVNQTSKSSINYKSSLNNVSMSLNKKK
jgi:hypothetical protein